MRCLQRRPIRAQKEGGNREKAWSMLQGNTKKGKKQKPLQQGLLTENLAPPAGFEPVACRLGDGPKRHKHYQSSIKKPREIKAFLQVRCKSGTSKIKPK